MFESIQNWFVEFQLEQGYLIKPLIVGTLVSIVCSVVGCFIVLRRMSFLADAIAHSMLAGVIGGYLVMKIMFEREADLGGMLIGAIFAGVATVAMIGFVTRVSRIKQDTAIGIMYTGIFAAGAFAVSLKSVGGLIHVDILHFIVGSVMAVSNADLWLLAIVTSIVLSAVMLFYRPLQITSFDPVMAASIGIPVLAVDYLLTACTSLVVVSGVRVAGVILVVALIITPAATAYLLTDKLNRMIVLSAAIGVTGFWLGFGAAVLFGASPGSSVVVTMTLLFLLVLAVAPRYGLVADWIRKTNSVPQEIMEDVLGAVLRAEGKSVPVAKIIEKVTSQNMKIRRAITLLARQDLLTVDNGHVRLTEDGRKEANRLVRAHRLWETYLAQTGTPEKEVHRKAHQLEHISDKATVDYLDDKLGHPLTDPHGSEIPQDASHLESGQELKASVLREGHTARICQIGKQAQSLGLVIGQKIRMGKRTEGGTVWNFDLKGGRSLGISHDQADALSVQMISSDEFEHPD